MSAAEKIEKYTDEWYRWLIERDDELTNQEGRDLLAFIWGGGIDRGDTLWERAFDKVAMCIPWEPQDDIEAETP